IPRTSTAPSVSIHPCAEAVRRRTAARWSAAQDTEETNRAARPQQTASRGRGCGTSRTRARTCPTHVPASPDRRPRRRAPSCHHTRRSGGGSMRRHTTTKGFALAPADEARLERRVARLEKRLRPLDPDPGHLQAVIQKPPRRVEY